LWAKHLPEFGWEPIVVTAHPRYYAEKLDPALLQLVDPSIRVVHTKAIPAGPPRIIGDIGLRALYWQFEALNGLIARKEVDFLHITIPSNFAALLGQALYRRHRFPFGVDYQDPWVHVWPGVEKTFSKAWLSHRLGTWLEPWAVKNAALITGVAESYYQPVLERNPHLRDRCVTAAMPIGNSEADYEALGRSARDTFLFRKDDGLFHMVYAGALLPKAHVILERFLESLVVLRDREPAIMDRLRVHFVGTGTSPNDPEGYSIRPYLQRMGLERWVDEHPHRIGYVDVLNHLVNASAILILGSTESHYTPSKVYQAVQAKRPVFALLHEQSTAVALLHDVGAGSVTTLTESRLPPAGELASALSAFIQAPPSSLKQFRSALFEPYSARHSARLLADALERALNLFAESGEGERDRSRRPIEKAAPSA
jgi:hypothetical protein